MKKQTTILLLFALLMAGYSCQILRFCTAAKQYSTTHTCSKGLVKRVVACVNPGSAIEKKLLILKKAITLNHTANEFYTNALLAFLSGNIPAAHHFYVYHDYFSPHLFFSGKRGPPPVA